MFLLLLQRDLLLLPAELTGAGQADKKFDIDLATSYAAEGPAGKALVKFVADVKEKSGGSVNINLFTDGTLGNPKDN